MHLFLNSLHDSPATGLDNTSYAGQFNVPTVPTPNDFYPATPNQTGALGLPQTILGLPTGTVLLIVAVIAAIILLRKKG